MMWKAQVLTSWTVDSDGANVPAILAFLQAGDSAVDITGQPAQNITPDPNAVVWQVECSEATLDAINADAGHTVLWQEEITDGG